jgi:hypothetical protein
LWLSQWVRSLAATAYWKVGDAMEGGDLLFGCGSEVGAIH